METENNTKKVPVKKHKRITKFLVVILLALTLILLFVVPGLISSKMGKGFILGKINSNLAGQADFNNLSMSWYKGIKITGISFKGNKGLINIAIKQLITKPKYAYFGFVISCFIAIFMSPLLPLKLIPVIFIPLYQLIDKLLKSA